MANNMGPSIVMDEYYGCVRVNGVLCPDPISYAPFAPPPPPPPPRKQKKRAGPTKKRRRCLTASRVLETGDVYMKLLQCIDDQKYVLELRDVNHRNASVIDTTFHGLSPKIRSGRKIIQATENNSLDEKPMFPVTEEVFSEAGNTKYKLPMKERLNGDWTYEIRKRNRNGKVEKFYYHGTVSKTIRSANDIATFIMYAK